MSKNDPIVTAACIFVALIALMYVAVFAAIAAVPFAVAWGIWKYYDYNRPIPTYEPPPQIEEPFALTDTHLREHVAIFAPSGWGKTQFLETYIPSLMLRPNAPALFVLDSQDDMLGKLERLNILLERPLSKTYVIDPADRPALNFFSFKGGPTETNELFAYLFSSVERELSGPQATVISYLMRLMNVIPNPTIKTLLAIVESNAPHPDIRLLDETAQDFFVNQFYKKGSMQLTRTAVAGKCYAILENKALEEMFSASENKFDVADAMENGAWCFISTSTKQLGVANSALFGRYFIAQILAACYRLGTTNRLRAVLVLDEAFEYFDDKTERILSQARKYGLGLTFATQHLNQMDQNLRKSVFGNTAVKIAGKVGHDDAVTLAKEMDVDSDTMRSLKKTDRGTTFLVSASGLKPTILSVPYGTLNEIPRMSEKEHRIFRRLNKERLAATPNHSQHKDEPRGHAEKKASPPDTGNPPWEFDTNH